MGSRLIFQLRRHNLEIPAPDRQPIGQLDATVKNNFPRIHNLRLDPFEKMGFDPNESFMSFEHFYGPNFWRFVFMQGEVAKLAESAIDFPPMQASASFNLAAVKKKIAAPRLGTGSESLTGARLVRRAHFAILSPPKRSPLGGAVLSRAKHASA